VSSYRLLNDVFLASTLFFSEIQFFNSFSFECKVTFSYIHEDFQGETFNTKNPSGNDSLFAKKVKIYSKINACKKPLSPFVVLWRKQMYMLLPLPQPVKVVNNGLSFYAIHDIKG